MHLRGAKEVEISQPGKNTHIACVYVWNVQTKAFEWCPTQWRRADQSGGQAKTKSENKDTPLDLTRLNSPVGLMDVSKGSRQMANPTKNVTLVSILRSGIQLHHTNPKKMGKLAVLQTGTVNMSDLGISKSPGTIARKAITIAHSSTCKIEATSMTNWIGSSSVSGTHLNRGRGTSGISSVPGTHLNSGRGTAGSSSASGTHLNSGRGTSRGTFDYGVFQNNRSTEQFSHSESNLPFTDSIEPNRLIGRNMTTGRSNPTGEMIHTGNHGNIARHELNTSLSGIILHGTSTQSINSGVMKSGLSYPGKHSRYKT